VFTLYLDAREDFMFVRPVDSGGFSIELGGPERPSINEVRVCGMNPRNEIRFWHTTLRFDCGIRAISPKAS
jgi:hypothetical protein